MVKKKGSKEPEPTDLLRTSDFRLLYTMGAMGGFNPYDFRMTFYNEVYTEQDEKKVIVTPVQLVMSHIAAKELALWLSKQVKEYENKVGKIERPDLSKLTKEKKK